MTLRLNGSTSGYVELDAPAIAGATALTLPASSGTIATTAYVDTAGGLQLITTQTFSTVSSVSVNNCFTSTYENYLVVVDINAIASGTADVNWRGRISGSDQADAYYGGSLKIVHSGTALTGANINAVTTVKIGDISAVSSVNYLRSTLRIYSPQSSTKRTSLTWETISYDGSGLYFGHGGAQSWSTLSSLDGFSIYPSASTITGVLRVYGLKS